MIEYLTSTVGEVFDSTLSSRRPPRTSVVSSGMMLSSASIVSDSLPSISTTTSPLPSTTISSNPLTSRDSVITLPDPRTPTTSVPHAETDNAASTAAPTKIDARPEIRSPLWPVPAARWGPKRKCTPAGGQTLQPYQRGTTAARPGIPEKRHSIDGEEWATGVGPYHASTVDSRRRS